jgi:hypothetical protein
MISFFPKSIKGCLLTPAALIVSFGIAGQVGLLLQENDICTVASGIAFSVTFCSLMAFYRTLWVHFHRHEVDQSILID